MNRTSHSDIAYIRKVTALFNDASNKNEGVLRVVFVTDEAGRKNHKDKIPTLAGLIDTPTGALRLQEVQQLIQMGGAAVCWGPANNFKLKVDEDTNLKLFFKYDPTGDYQAVHIFHNKSSAWTETGEGTDVELGTAGLFAGGYNRWKVWYDAEDGTLKVGISSGLTYTVKHQWGESFSEGSVVSDKLSLNAAALTFGRYDNYKLYCDEDGYLTLAQKNLGTDTTWPLIHFKIGVDRNEEIPIQ